jgi:preprotein translocase SecE subunit
VARNRQRARPNRPQPRGGGPLPAAGGGAGQPPIQDDPVAFADDADDEPREEDSMSAASAAFGPGASPLVPRRRKANLAVRTVSFLEGSWAELRRVQWPDRPQVVQGTSVVLGFVVLTGVFLGVCDFVAAKLVNWIV